MLFLPLNSTNPILRLMDLYPRFNFNFWWVASYPTDPSYVFYNSVPLNKLSKSGIINLKKTERLFLKKQKNCLQDKLCLEL